jgi:stage II sporulation protein M
MVPMLGIILLGAECGFIVSTATHLFGSYFIGIMSLVPHGIIEIPAFSLAGAVSFSGHLMVKEAAGNNSSDIVFGHIQAYRNTLPIRTIALFVILCLLIAGFVEAHVTEKVVGFFFNTPRV